MAEKINENKKRRGRPAKVLTEEEIAQAAKPKRRGRPAKVLTEEEIAQAAKSKKRGRPARNEANKNNVPAEKKITKKTKAVSKSKKTSASTFNLSREIPVYGNAKDLRSGHYRPEKSVYKIAKMSVKGKEIDVELFSDFDFSGFENKELVALYKTQHIARRLDEKAALYLKMAKGWSYHAAVGGHDGIQMALGQIFRTKKDHMFPYYRDFITSISAGMTPVEIILNGLSKATDLAGGGRHMSNHFAKIEDNIYNVSSCTGNHSQHAAGLGRAIKKYGGDEVVYYSGGDSACGEGYFYEAVAAASFDKSPVVFVIQNNQFGISVPLDEVNDNLVVSDSYSGIRNLKIIECDGRDFFASFKALKDAQEYALSGAGPAMVHAECDRIGSHSNSDNHIGYRSDDERNVLSVRDPLMQFRYHLLNRGIATLEEIEAIEEANKQEIFAAADEAEAEPNADGKTWREFIYAPAHVSESDNTEVAIPEGSEDVSMLDGINYALKQEFRANENTFMWGQDIGKGGVFNVVKGMPGEFSKNRVFNAPIAEDMIMGTAFGFSHYRDDIRVVIEGAEFADYIYPAMEQYVEMGQSYWRTNGQNAPNVTMRLASGGYIQGGIYHSQNVEGILTTIPGVRVVQPAFADDAIGLLRNCIRSEGPSIFLEPKFLYNFKQAHGPVPPDDFVIPFGKGKIRREGTDVTVITYGTAVHMSNFAAEQLEKEGISVKIFDLRSLQPWDKAGAIAHAKETGRCIVIHEDMKTGGFGGEIASTIQEEAFEHLDAPVMRHASEDCWVGFAKVFEDEILIQIPDVISAIRKCAKY
jgi:2-oxoisovalerate dehydrogenase E1 component